MHSSSSAPPGAFNRIRRTRRLRRVFLSGLVAASLLIVFARLASGLPSIDTLLPRTLYTLDLIMRFEGHGEELSIRTFLPLSGERQTIFDEVVQAGSLHFVRQEQPGGQVGWWSGDRVRGPREVSYRVRVAPVGVRFEIPSELPLAREIAPRLSRDLGDTEFIQVSHPEIGALWERVRPEEMTVDRVLRAIFKHAYEEIEATEFKGTTDALTAQRLGQASCNGKSRLFVALARRAGIPARLVGGIILNPGTKKTSHQWVEAHIAGRWVPFCPTNGHFAEIPQHYMKLYQGDESLFTHTRDINFDYSFTVSRQVVPAVDVPFANGGTSSEQLRAPTKLFGIDAGLSRVFLLLPLAALVIVIFRNVVGLESFGVFLPMLIAAAASYTGLLFGISAFLGVVLIAALVSGWMDRLQFLRVPRVSALITVITLLVIAVVAVLPGGLGSRMALLAMFPSVILSFTADRFNRIADRKGRLALAGVVLSTSLVIAVCYWVINSVVLQTVVSAFPETLMLVIAAQLALGRWTGLRLTERVRFRSLLRQAERQDSGGTDSIVEEPAFGDNLILGINARNLDALKVLNAPDVVEIADDKLLTKEALVRAEVPVPRTFAVIRNALDIRATARRMEHWEDFVLKPCRGSGGQGIVLVIGRAGELYRIADGTYWTIEDIRRHLSEILAGVHSDGERDRAIVEERISPPAVLTRLAPRGLCDLRVIVVRGQPIASMLRVPTSGSGGRANLHQGAVGVPIDQESGRTSAGRIAGRPISRHPDTGLALGGIVVPDWPKVLDIAARSIEAVPLGLAGVDVTLDAKRGPVVLEVNARPGLEIQNINGRGLRGEIQRLVHGTRAEECQAG